MILSVLLSSVIPGVTFQLLLHLRHLRRQKASLINIIPKSINEITVAMYWTMQKTMNSFQYELDLLCKFSAYSRTK